jgi:Cd2+/Zn2+-exporting ATPase
VIPFDGRSEESVLAVAAAVEAGSEHHLARAVVDEARRRGIAAAPVSDFKALPGLGATALLDGRRWFVGRRRLFDENGIGDAKSRDAGDAVERDGRTVVLVGSAEGVVGAIALSDTVRPGAKRALESLRALGVRDFVMLTVDNEGAARLVASELGIEEYRARLLPEDKVAAVREMVSAGRRVAMVGDGINDAPALAASSLGVAMGTKGSDTALETADVALMADDLTKLRFGVRMGRRAASVIRQNVALALGLKLVFLALAFAGMADLWMAVVADMGASLAVTFNGMRVLLLRHQTSQGVAAEHSGRA